MYWVGNVNGPQKFYETELAKMPEKIGFTGSNLLWGRLHPAPSRYDWTIIDEWLDLPCVKSGAVTVNFRISLRGGRGVPSWAPAAQITLGKTKVFATNQVYANEIWAEFCQAFGKRYAGDSRLAFVVLTEHVRFGLTPPGWHKPGIGGFLGAKAWDYGIIQSARAMAAAMPLVFQGSVRDPIAYGYDEFKGKGVLDAGIGLFLPDPRFFFKTCGSKGGVDCGNDFYRTAQANPGLVCASHEPNGWRMNSFPRDTPFGKKGTRLNPITLDFWYWYFGPRGVIPATHYRCILGSKENFKWEDHAAAIKRLRSAEPPPPPVGRDPVPPDHLKLVLSGAPAPEGYAYDVRATVRERRLSDGKLSAVGEVGIDRATLPE